MSEGYDVYCGLLRMYDGFSATPDAGVPAFEYGHSHHGLAQCADATGSTAWPEMATR